MTDVIGILDDGWASLTESARATLREAACVIGAERTIALVSAHLTPGTLTRNVNGALDEVAGWIENARRDGLRCAVLRTGDPLCHGIATYLIGKLGADAIRVLPAPTTLQIAFARWKKPWQDVAIGSVHGKKAGEWIDGATPEHGLYQLVRQVAEHPRVAAFTSPHNSPDRIARALIAAGFADEARLSIASRLCLPDEAVAADLPLTVAAERHFDVPNVVLIERPAAPPRAVFGFDDSDYVQRSPEKGLITKLEARAVSLAKLGLRTDSIVWDIGAGSGSVGLEASRIARQGHVWAIEKNADEAANARANARRLRAGNYTLVHAKAPQALATWPDPDAVFIGGSGGELVALIRLILSRLNPAGRLVMNFVSIENLATATAALAGAGVHWELSQLSAARSQPILDLHRLAALNPVWIVTAYEDPK